MADDRYSHPVSGEILPVGDQPVRGRSAGADVADAEFETIDAPLRADAAPSADDQPTAPAAPGMDVLKARGSTDAASRGGPAFWVLGLALAAGAFWVSGGHALVREPAATRAVESTSGPAFRIEDVVSRIEDAGGRHVLFVDGVAINGGAGAAMLPAIEIRVTGGDGRLLRYKLGTSATQLAPGARFSFSSRLEAPRDGVKSVQVAFADEKD
ncbi:MAG: hypothetical protein KF723_15770 [Rhizobiaceae bacterium]|nr:hypothetical protein [Rhizobiaceae bacterium]